MLENNDNSFSHDTSTTVSMALQDIQNRQTKLEMLLEKIVQLVERQHRQKEWYSTTELAEAMGKSRYTIQERWCNDGRIDCEKDPESGKWRIPGGEYERLVNGGRLKPKRN